MVKNKIIYTKGCEGNNFLPMPDKNIIADIIYICSPNNPTGAAYNKNQLKIWVDYARENNAIILFDAAYEIFLQDGSLPSSIYQIEGAKECAIEFSSFSKTAGFTGVRCSYTVIPHALKRDGQAIGKLWLRRQSTKYNGVPYIVQRGAEAALLEEGFAQIKQNIAYYQQNTKIISSALQEMGIWFTGGENSPYIWLKCPNNMSSWEFFDKVLTEANVIGTPGAGFGEMGEGYFRLSAFANKEDVSTAMQMLKKM
jgi:LL-diaminopimelate aminotransferase